MKRVSGWWWAGGGIALLGLLIAGAISWFYSDADLRRVQAEARAAGLATTWDEAGFREMSVPEKKALDRVIAASRSQSSLTRKDPLKAPRQVEPPTDALIAHHAGIPQEIWDEVDAALDGLPPSPFPLFERFTLATRLDANQEQRELMRLLAERIRLCPAGSLPELVAKAARVAHLTQSQTLIQQLIDISSTAILCPAIAARRNDLRNTAHAPLVATTLRLLRDRLWHARIETLRGEGAVMFHTYAHIDQIPLFASPSPSSGVWERTLETLRAPLALVVYRLNREAALRQLVDVEVATAAAADSPDLLRRSASMPPPKARLEWLTSLAQVNPFPINGAYTMINANLVKTLLTLDVVACDLVGDPLPQDPFSPLPAPLYPVERNGVVIGWYSVGPNGIDDGGQNGKDHGIPLAEAFGNTFAGPPKPR